MSVLSGILPMSSKVITTLEGELARGPCARLRVGHFPSVMLVIPRWAGMMANLFVSVNFAHPVFDSYLCVPLF